MAIAGTAAAARRCMRRGVEAIVQRGRSEAAEAGGGGEGSEGFTGAWGASCSLSRREKAMRCEIAPQAGTEINAGDQFRASQQGPFAQAGAMSVART